MSHRFISSILTHKSHFIFANHALEWLPFHQVWQPFGRPEDALKGCITFIDANQRAYLSMKTGLDWGRSNDLCFCCKSRLFWLCVTQPSFPPSPLSLMEAKPRFSSGLLCVCLLISAPLFPFQHYNHYFSWHREAVLVCCFSLSFSMYLSMYLFICLSISPCPRLSIFLVCLFFVLSIFLSVPFLFLVSLITNTHAQGTAPQV